MKKLLFIAAYFLIVTSACNKDKKFNKLLDGTWITTSINGATVTMADNPIQYQFSKSNNYGGTIKVTYFDKNKVTDEYAGTYKVSGDGTKITIDAKGINASSSEPDLNIISDISNKTDKKFTSTQNGDARRGFVFESIFVFEKQ